MLARELGRAGRTQHQYSGVQQSGAARASRESPLSKSAGGEGEIRAARDTRGGRPSRRLTGWSTTSLESRRDTLIHSHALLSVAKGRTYAAHRRAHLLDLKRLLAQLPALKYQSPLQSQFAWRPRHPKHGKRDRPRKERGSQRRARFRRPHISHRDVTDLASAVQCEICPRSVSEGGIEISRRE